MKIKVVQLYSAAVLLFSTYIPSILVFYSPIYTVPFFYIRLLLCVILLIQLFVNKKKLSAGFWMVTICTGWIILTNFLFGISYLSYSVYTITYPFLASLFLEANKKNSLDIIKAWAFLLRILTYIDIITMIMYPEGMFTSSLYSINWFLGYKTERLVFCLPMTVFTCYISFKDKGRFGIKSYWTLLLALFTTRFSDSTAAFYCLLVLGLIIVLYDFKNKLKINLDIIYKIFNLKILVPLYAVVTYFTINIVNSPLMQFIVVNILGKSMTLTTRTDIWDKVIPKVKESPFTGYGIITSQVYTDITGNKYATSAHNMTLQILMTGGLILMAMYIVGIFICCYVSNRKYSIPEIILFAGIISELIVGVTSSAFVFSTFGFMFYHLMSLEKAQTNLEIDKNEDLKHQLYKPHIKVIPF